MTSREAPSTTAPSVIRRLVASTNVLVERVVRDMIQEVLAGRFESIEEGVSCIPLYDPLALKMHAAANAADTPTAQYVAAQAVLSSYKLLLPRPPRLSSAENGEHGLF